MLYTKSSRLLIMSPTMMIALTDNAGGVMEKNQKKLFQSLGKVRGSTEYPYCGKTQTLF